MPEEDGPIKRGLVARSADFVDRHWKPLTFVGIIILLFGAGILALNQISTGTFMQRDFELTGGKQIEIELTGAPDLNAIKSALPDASISLISGLRQTLLIEIPVESDEEEVLRTLEEMEITGEYSIRTVGPMLGELFWQQTQIAIAAAFVLMSIVIFILFRTPAPSAAVILAALTDAVFALALLSLLGQKLSLPILAGMLMLIGYSVDTDIVLTTELLRSKDKPVSKRFRAATKTGLTLTIIALAALATMYFVSGSIVIQQIVGVLIIGLTVDMFSTWFTNAGILRWHLERKAARSGV